MSFASLKKASSGGDTFAKLTREIDKLNQARCWFFCDERFWKPELDKSGNGYAVIRFLLLPMAKKCLGEGLVSCFQRSWWTVVHRELFDHHRQG